MAKQDNIMHDESGQLDDHTISIYRTAATVKGGRRFSFGALVIVGDRNGRIGYGYAKANEVPSAIEKAQKEAKRSMITIPRIGTTINHEVEGRFSSSKVRLIPASPGTGVVAGGTVRAILEMVGITDCLTKCFGTTNARNVVKAVFDGLGQLRTPEQFQEMRGVEIGETLIAAKIERGRAFMPQTTGGERAKAPVNTVGQDRRGGGRGGRGGRGGGRGGRGGGRGGFGGDAPPAPAAAPAAPAESGGGESGGDKPAGGEGAAS